MSRFKKYLIERPKFPVGTYTNDFEDFTEDIKKIDPEFLKMRFYSGRTDANEKIFVKNIRQNRQPKDIDYISHKALDSFFKEIFGVEARSKSIFITKDINTANYYGSPYLVYPIGKYKYIWSPIVRDLLDIMKDPISFGLDGKYIDINLRDLLWIFSDKYNENMYMGVNGVSKRINKELFEYLKTKKQKIHGVIKNFIKDNYTNRDLDETGKFSFGEEVMLVCKEVLLVKDIYEKRWLKYLREMGYKI